MTEIGTVPIVRPPLLLIPGCEFGVDGFGEDRGTERTHRVYLDLIRHIAKPVDATVFENQARPDHEVTNHVGNQGFTGPGRCRDTRRDMSCDAADFAVREVNLTEMDATAQSYTQWRDVIGNGVRAANSGGRGIKDRHKAVSTIPDFPAAKPVDLAACRGVVPVE